MKQEGRNGVLSSFFSIRTQSPPGPKNAALAFLRMNEGEKEGTQLSGLLTSAMASLSPPPRAGHTAWEEAGRHELSLSSCLDPLTRSSRYYGNGEGGAEAENLQG